MNTSEVLHIIQSGRRNGFDLYERRPGIYQLIVPILHEDGDMIDIYLQDGPNGKDSIRLCDFAMTLMRISYTYEISSPTRQKIFDSILINNGIQNDSGNLYVDTTHEMLYECIMQFAGGIQKVCSMSYWSREFLRSSFYENVKEYVTTELAQFNPLPDLAPLETYEVISVDWSLTHKNRNLYLFGVRGNEKAKSTAISLLEFKKAQLPFISIVVHEDIQELGKKESIYLTKNADTQYPTLADCEENAHRDILRLVA